jgi:hypothetical protein
VPSQRESNAATQVRRAGNDDHQHEEEQVDDSAEGEDRKTSAARVPASRVSSHPAQAA